MQIELKKIKFNDNSRAKLVDKDMPGLMQSIKENGLVTPISVRQTKKRPQEFEVIAGHRRFMAFKKLGIKAIPAVVLTADKKEMKFMNIVENLQRKDINVVERGRFLQQIMDEYDMTQAEVAVRLGVNKSHVKSCINAFSGVPKEYQKDIVISNGQPHKAKKSVPLSTASTIIDVSRKQKLTPSQKKQLFAMAKDENLTAAKISGVAKEMKSGKGFARAVKNVEKGLSVNVGVLIPADEQKRLDDKYPTITYQELLKGIVSGKIKEKIKLIV